MLVLSRMPGQSIIIDNDIVVRILNVNGNQVKLGISAPENICIHREEIWWRIKNETDNKHAIQNSKEIYNPNNPEGKPFYIYSDEMDAIEEEDKPDSFQSEDEIDSLEGD